MERQPRNLGRRYEGNKQNGRDSLPQGIQQLSGGQRILSTSLGHQF